MLNICFLLYFFVSKITCNYFVTSLEKPEYFNLLKNNIGFIHKYYKNAITLVVIDIESELYPELVDQILYWKRVHVVDKKNIFLSNAPYIKLSSAKSKIALIDFVFENYLHFETTNVFVFDIFVSLFKSIDLISKLFILKKISFSDKHLFLNYSTYKNDIKNIKNAILLNKFEDKDAYTVKTDYMNLVLKKSEVESNSLSCRVDYKHLHFSALYKDKKVFNSFNKTRIALLIPTLNLNVNIDEMPLFNQTLPSLVKTISRFELGNISLTLYIAYDTSDIFFKTKNSTEIHQNKIINLFGKNKAIQVKYLKFPKSKSVVLLWNSLFVEAFTDGNEFFVQLNDDTELFDQGWLSAAIMQFRAGFDGIIGFNSKEWGCKLFTQTIVSRMHFVKNNGNYYPMEFHNCMSDIWITEYYKNNRICLNTHRTFNHHSKTRYERCPYNRKLLQKLLPFYDVKY